ncbi:hypothetical protein [Flavobacterium tibetense]|uniref:Uncharacterized protein n=1 Tax=Flavobacterium tibetense TaxID=2233533 RepID=A0A365P4R1_9FLAO|nr:hypothetical protein [Flavobacterium tibetense]RBA29567.1 hypothetical protein DPN68_02670 [Flavobacterium tibetense]
MKKVVLSLALVAMMFVSCKEAEANTEEVVVEETVEVVEEVAAPVAEDTTATTEEVVTEEVAQ